MLLNVPDNEYKRVTPKYCQLSRDFQLFCPTLIMVVDEVDGSLASDGSGIEEYCSKS
jgi:hypothetical protein